MTDQAFELYCDEVRARLAHKCVHAAHVGPEAARQYVTATFPEAMRGACMAAGYDSGLPALYPARALVDFHFEIMNAQSLLWKMFNRNNFQWVMIKSLKRHFDGLVWALNDDAYRRFRGGCRARFPDLVDADPQLGEIRPTARAGRPPWRGEELPAPSAA